MLNNPIFQQGIEEKPHNILGEGAHCIAFEEGHHTVLLATRQLAAKKIFLLSKSLSHAEQFPPGFELPQHIATNVNLSSIIDPTKPPDRLRKRHHELLTVSPRDIWNTNYIFRLTRYEGTLEKFHTIKFNESDIELIRSTLTNILDFFHANKITHNDIAKRNIYYKKSNDKFSFYLGDFSSITHDESEKTYLRKCEKDRSSLEMLLKSLEHLLDQKRSRKLGRNYTVQYRFSRKTISKRALKNPRPICSNSRYQ